MENKFKYYVNGLEYETMAEAEMVVAAYVEATHIDESYYDGEYGDDLFNEYENQITAVNQNGNEYRYSEYFELLSKGDRS